MVAPFYRALNCTEFMYKFRYTRVQNSIPPLMSGASRVHNEWFIGSCMDNLSVPLKKGDV